MVPVNVSVPLLAELAAAAVTAPAPEIVSVPLELNDAAAAVTAPKGCRLREEHRRAAAKNQSDHTAWAVSASGPVGLTGVGMVLSGPMHLGVVVVAAWRVSRRWIKRVNH